MWDSHGMVQEPLSRMDSRIYDKCHSNYIIVFANYTIIEYFSDDSDDEVRYYTNSKEHLKKLVKENAPQGLFLVLSVIREQTKTFRVRSR